uniref:OSJNBa0039K24.3 protein n=1 Tax=Oryza sativa subsp. japonica TaxID=39947 RepID=Q7XSV3_ORYSJ|nr:OSJNBa0039K24.3 [Oryza sativa Japonica Group]
MPATDSSSAAAPLTSFGRSFLSHRRDQIPPPPPDHHSHSHTQHPSSSDLEIDAFHRHAADLLHDLLSDSNSDPSAPDLLSLAWTRRLLDSFLICLEEFRAILFALADSQPLSRPPLDRLLLDFLDRAVKALDLCNALRDGLDLIRQWRKHLAIAAAALATAPAAQRGEAQIRRARKALTDLTILMLDDKDAGGVVGQRNRSFGSASTTRTPFPTATATTAGAAAAGAPGPALAPISGLTVPRANDIAATGGLASAVYAMGAVLFVVTWALVAAIPCQDRGLQAHLTAVPRTFPWAGPLITLFDRILDESKKKDRKHSCGLLKEIHQIERCSRQLMEVTDAAEFPLADDKDSEVQEATQELVQVCGSLKDGLDPLERQVREMFHRVVRTRTEILDYLSRPHNAG